MADYAIPKSGVAYIFYGCLVSQADTKLFKSAPTLAPGDFKVSIDGGAFANLATLPTNTPGTFSVKFSLSAGEMTGDNILVVASDAAGAEWCDQSWNIQTSARGIADLAYPTVSGRSLDVSAGGEAGVDWANVGSPTTANALTGTTIATTQKVDVETIKTNPVVNAGTITFPTTATLASTTNITAGTITTVTNLTNAPTSGDLTAVMKASVTTAATAATPTAAAVTAGVTVTTNNDKTGYALTAVTGLGNQTANITGNLSGSVNSVTSNVNADVVKLNGDATAAAVLAVLNGTTIVYSGTVTGAATTTTLIDSGLTQADTDWWKGRIIIFKSVIALQATDITGFDPATDKLTFTACTQAPTGATYVII